MMCNKTIISEGAVYPGHPVTLALLIMHRYPSLSEAKAPTPSSGFRSALADINIPGAGGEVSGALTLLEKIGAGELNTEDAIEWGKASWARNAENCYADRVVPGQQQADRLSQQFAEKVAGWDFLSGKAGPAAT